MTYKLLIADDEYFIRKRIKKIIQDSDLNFNIIIEAENGEEVLTHLQETPVDLVLLDIKMPHMSGLEVCEQIQNHYPTTKVIILSGYNEFEFARKALQTGVFDYLLKPIRQEELICSIETCLTKLEEEHAYQRKLLRYSLEEKRHSIQQFFRKEITREGLLHSYPDLTFVKYSFYTAFYTNILTNQLVEDLILCLNTKQLNFIYFQETDHSFLFQFFADSCETMAFVRQKVTSLFSFFCPNCFFRTDEAFLLDKYKPEQYSHAKDLLLLRFFPVSVSNPAALKFHHSQLAKIRQELNAILNAHNEHSLQTYITELLDSVLLTQNPRNLRIIIIEILITLQLYNSSSFDIQDMVNTILDEEENFDGLKDSILSVCFESIKNSEYTPSECLISQQIATYVQENYKQDLSVASIAKFWKLHPSYLSNMFKKTYKLSINQYITKVRMERAKELLQNRDYKISEIAEMTGYTDVFYFSKRFKKYWGQPPKTFQNSV